MARKAKAGKKTEKATKEKVAKEKPSDASNDEEVVSSKEEEVDTAVENEKASKDDKKPKAGRKRKAVVAVAPVQRPVRSTRNKKPQINDDVDEDESEEEEVQSKSPKKKKKESKKVENDKEESEPEAEDELLADIKNIYEFKVNDINGDEVALEKYKGHVCVIVNVASRCGHTKANYEQFVELYKKYSEDKGLRILAFPCNQFGSQEPGDSNKICEFAKGKGVTFDMFEKVAVNGKNAIPLFKYLKDKLPDSAAKGKYSINDIKWNFTKFIIDKDGVPVARFAPATKPNQLVETLEKYW